MRHFRFAVAITGLMGLQAGSSMGETIGAYQIIDVPVHASQTQGGSIVSHWLNVVDAPVSLEQAFTGFGVIDDGIHDVGAGTQIALTFAPGVLRNGPGPDLVLFDAELDLNVYLVNTSFNFNQIRVVGDFVDTGVDRVYYYGLGGPPQSYNIYAATIDLSMFGVPANQTVDSVLIFTEGPSCDPLGLGVLLSTCPSDVDGDGAVGLADLAQLLSAFGSAWGGAAWNPHADLDASGDIGLSDLTILLAHFGESC